MPDVCRAYDAYEAYEVWKEIFLTPFTAANSFHRPRGGPPPSRREVLGGCVPARSLLYNPGCRVETLLVSMGVMGFLGDLRGRNSKSPPNPLGLAERVYSFHRPRGGPPPSKREVLGFRRSKPAALPSIGYRGFAVAPMTLRAPLRGTAVQPTVANTSDRCNDATQRCKHISQLQFPATL